MLDVTLKGDSVDLCDEIWLKYIWMLVRVVLLVLKIYRYDPIFLAIQEAFYLLHFDQAINLNGC